MKQKVKSHKRKGKPVKGYDRKRRVRLKSPKLKRRFVGRYSRYIIQNPYGEIIGTKLVKAKK